MSGRIVWVLAVIALTVVAMPASADPIAISNHSFEEPDVTGMAETWSNINLNWGDDAGDSGDEFTEFIDGFAAEGTQHTGVQNLSAIMQDLEVPYAADTLYTLTVGVGNRAGFTSPDNQSLIQLGDASSGNILAERSVDASLVPETAFEDYTLRYLVSPFSEAIGNNIRVQLGVGSSGDRAHFDNVRLESEPLRFADLNMDEVVDENDFFVLSDNFYAHLDGPVTYEQGDLNFDDAIDFADFRLLKETLALSGGALANAAAVPEPATLTLLICAAAVLSLRLQRKQIRK